MSWFVGFAAAMYSASVEDWATTSCFLELQEKTPFPNEKQ